MLCEITDRKRQIISFFACMAESSHQEPTDGLNVPGDPSAEEFEESHDKSKSEDQAPSDLKDGIQLWDSLGPRQRNLTKKGLGERINWLKQQRMNALRAVSRKRTEVSGLMVSPTNLHLVKAELINLNDLIEEYSEASHAYCEEATSVEAKDRGYAHHEERINDIEAYLLPVHAWISQAETQLTDQLERISSKGSGQASKVSSRLSARDKERVRLVELKAERSMLKQKQALTAAEGNLELELEVVKAEAREKALDEIDKEQIPLLLSGTVPPSVVSSFPPIVVPSLPASSPDDVALHPKALVSTVQTPAAAETQVMSTLQGPGTTLATDSAVKTLILILMPKNLFQLHSRMVLYLHHTMFMVQKTLKKLDMEFPSFSRLSLWSVPLRV